MWKCVKNINKNTWNLTLLDFKTISYEIISLQPKYLAWLYFKFQLCIFLNFYDLTKLVLGGKSQSNVFSEIRRYSN
jgi:hypothetical protein